MNLQWGNVAAWVSAALTLIAVVVALTLPRWQRKQDLSDRAAVVEDAVNAKSASDLEELREVLYVALACGGGVVPAEILGSLGNLLAHRTRIAPGHQVVALLLRLGRTTEHVSERREALRRLVDEVSQRLEEPMTEWVHPDATELLSVWYPDRGKAVATEVSHRNRHLYVLVEDSASPANGFYKRVEET